MTPQMQVVVPSFALINNGSPQPSPSAKTNSRTPTKTTTIAMTPSPSPSGATPSATTRTKPSPIQIPSHSTIPLFSSYPVVTYTGQELDGQEYPDDLRRYHHHRYPAISPTSPITKWHADQNFPPSTEVSTPVTPTPLSVSFPDRYISAVFLGRQNSCTHSDSVLAGPSDPSSVSRGNLHRLPSIEAETQRRRQRRATLSSDVDASTRFTRQARSSWAPASAIPLLSSGDAMSVFGPLPPGASPAINPAAHAQYELTSSARYQALGANVPGGPPFGAVRVPFPNVPPKPEITVVVHAGSNSSPKHSFQSPGPSRPQSPTHSHPQHSSPKSHGFTYTSSPEATFTLQSISTITLGIPLVSPAGSIPKSNAVSDADFFNSKALPGTPTPNLPPGSEELKGALQLSHLYLTHPEHHAHLLSPVEDSVDAECRSSESSDKRFSIPESTLGLTGDDPMTSSASTSICRHSPTDQVTSWDQYVQDQQHKRFRQTQQKKYILVELVETESSYLCQLEDLVHVYFAQITARSIFTVNQINAISRNVQHLLKFHDALLKQMIRILKEEGLGCPLSSADHETDQIDRIANRIAELFLDQAPHFHLYEDYCSSSAFAMSLVRSVQHRPEWSSLETLCKHRVASRPRKRVHQLLADDNPNFKADGMPPATVSHSPSRLMLRDLLILPVQRVCRYPMMLSAFASVTEPMLEVVSSHSSKSSLSKIEQARILMASIAAKANDANNRSLIVASTTLLFKRLLEHPVLTRPFLDSLGLCNLAGTVEVVYHHSVLAPLVSPVKVRYFGAFLFRGYLILAKIKRANIYEIRHYLPLEVCDLTDIKEGFLPHSIRLTTGHLHHFDLAFSCSEEKDVWASALLEAKDDNVIPPFDLPISVPLANVRPRRDSLVMAPSYATPKRHSLGFTPNDEPVGSPSAASSPTLRSTRQLPLVPSQPLTVLLRRASSTYQAAIDSFLADITSDQISIARKAIQLDFGSTPPPTLRTRLSMRDSTMLRRRRSWLSNSNPVDRNSYASTVSDVSINKRHSIASSLKRGMSLASHQDFVDLADPTTVKVLPDDEGINPDLFEEEAMPANALIMRSKSRTRTSPATSFQHDILNRRSSLLNLTRERERETGRRLPHPPQRTHSMPLGAGSAIPRETGKGDGDGEGEGEGPDEGVKDEGNNNYSGTTSPSRCSDHGSSRHLDMYALKATLSSMRRQDSTRTTATTNTTTTTGTGIGTWTGTGTFTGPSSSGGNIISRSWSFASRRTAYSRRNSSDYGPSVSGMSAPASPHGLRTGRLLDDGGELCMSPTEELSSSEYGAASRMSMPPSKMTTATTTMPMRMRMGMGMSSDGGERSTASSDCSSESLYGPVHVHGGHSTPVARPQSTPSASSAGTIPTLNNPLPGRPPGRPPRRKRSLKLLAHLNPFTQITASHG